MTDDTITIGLAYDPTSRPAAVTFGYKAKGLPSSAYDILTREINRQGGIDGRKLKLHRWAYDFENYPNMAAYQAAECAHFTQDVEVFALITSISDQNSAPCYEEAGVSFLDPASSITDRELERAWPHYYNIASMDLNRTGELMVSGLARQGFFDGEHRIGFITFDDEMQRRATAQSVKPALAELGLALTEEVYVTPPRSGQELGMMLQQLNSAVVTFRAQGIDLVLFLDADGIIANRFTAAAEGQQYRGFRYGLTSLSIPSVVDQNGQPFVPPGQLRNALGVGWTPLTDVPRDVAETVLPRAARRCIELMEDNGIQFSQRCCDLNQALTRCDLLWFLEAGIESTRSSDVTAESFRRGVESLGTGYGSPRTFAPKFGPDRHQGAYGYREFAWSDACECVRYTSDILFPD